MSDGPSPRAAYLLTKVFVFVVAAALTWPIARAIGPRAWWGLAAFGAILAVVTAVVLLVTWRTSAPPPVGGAESTNGEDSDPDVPIAIPVEDSLDLHPFAPRDIPDVVTDYLDEAHRRGLAEVRLIHGRGIGVQRERVRSVLARHPLVVSFHDATPDRGGWGATIAYLKGTRAGSG